MTFSLPSAHERQSQATPKLDNLKAFKVMAFTAIQRQKLWFFVFITSPNEETRQKLGKYFANKKGEVFIYILDNSYAIEVW